LDIRGDIVHESPLSTKPIFIFRFGVGVISIGPIEFVKSNSPAKKGTLP